MFLKSSVSLKQEIKCSRIIDFIRILYTVASSSDTFAEDWAIVGEEETFLTRLKDEYDELKARHQKLGEFIGSDKFESIDERQRDLLKHQYGIMEDYANVLEVRIKDLEK